MFSGWKHCTRVPGLLTQSRWCAILLRMSIRIKEWGMMSQPAKGVHLPIEGLTGWGESARRVGEGISAVLVGSAKVMQDRAQVAAAGELADFSERLKAIDQETRDELSGQDVQDWDYAWNAASAPKLAEAINELSPASRRGAQELAEAYNARASVEAQRDHELRKIDKARSQWRNQLDQAVQAGDSQQAHEWLHAGQGIFVPEDHVQNESRAIESRASLSRWQKNLQETPLRTLSELSSASAQDLPQQKTDAQQLSHAVKLARGSAGEQVLANLVSCMEGGVSPDPEYMNLAVQAGVLTPDQASAASQESPRCLSLRQQQDWMRRIDESPHDDAEAVNLMLDIATANMPIADKRSLLNRVEISRRVPEASRRRLSRNLWTLYHNGAFGCPLDEPAQKFFSSLQQESLARLQQGDDEQIDAWLNSLNESADRWVCFLPEKSENV